MVFDRDYLKSPSDRFASRKNQRPKRKRKKKLNRKDNQGIPYEGSPGLDHRGMDET